ncbi:maleylacetoacetate isomerase [Aurantiacibacter flavus]|uniref:Maleylacetoacetate isomerase n=1 Tax=Aurantiacibacter flavus TaxID=3145232 RepID=A0ABV0CV27_9SPHN
MKLYGYYRSSTSYRLRIALNLKGLDYDIVPVNLLRSEQKEDQYRARNPFGGVPMLEVEGRDRAQSMAILEWLEDRFPAAPLLPEDAETRFTVRELTSAIATELHAPLNLKVLQYIKTQFEQDQNAVDAWYRHWLGLTLGPVEQRLAQLETGDFLLDRPGMFETVLIPQVYNARRFAYDLSQSPHIMRIEAACMQLPAFIAAHPDNQPDTPKEN